MYMTRTTLLLLTSTLWLGGHSLSIQSKVDLVEFSRRASMGNTFKGITVFLQNDIDLENVPFTPIGNNESPFQGKFDGQGHKISNLNITSTSGKYVGLFGSTADETLKNVVLDSSCHITFVSRSDVASTEFIGGIAGVIRSNEGSASMKNSINMASINVNLSKSFSVMVGGLIGYIIAYGEKAQIKNCGNAGDIAINKADGGDVFVGGILGLGLGDLADIKVINCVNTGMIKDENYMESRSKIGGGIIGVMYRGYLSNCVNLGELVFHTNSSSVGELIGDSLVTTGSQCYCKNNTFPAIGDNEDQSYFGYNFFDDGFTLNESVTVGEYTGDSLIGALNGFSDRYDMNGWLLNRNGKSVNFLIDSTKMSLNITFYSELILRPRVTDEDSYHFYGWYKDTAFKDPFYNQEIFADATLYGKYVVCDENFTITYDTAGKEDIKPVTKKFGEVVNLDRGHQQGEEVIGIWKDECGEDVKWKITMPAKNTTLYATWIDIMINTSEELKTFSENVYSGMSCAGVTVYLEDDLDMSGITNMRPIGGVGSKFEGTFDGKGHVIKNLAISSARPYTGLFGYSSTGMTIRNLVLDESCTITEKKSYSEFDIGLNNQIGLGSTIGYCVPKKRECVLENTIAMGSVSLSGNSFSSSEVIIGGLVGYFGTGTLNSIIRNSAFMGKVVVHNNVGMGYIGGIAGTMTGSAGLEQFKIENSLYSGEISVSGKAGHKLYIGGIVGYFLENSIVQNCVNIGSMDIDTNDTSAVAGIIAGYIENSVMNNCYWQQYTNVELEYGTNKDSEIKDVSSFSDDFNLNSKVSVATDAYNGYSLAEALNAFTLGGNSLSRWVTNYDETKVLFKVKDSSELSIKSKVILLPSFISGATSDFLGWYEQNYSSVLFIKHDIQGTDTLYGEWKDAQNEYTVSFVSMGKTIKTMKVKPGNDIEVDRVKTRRKGYNFVKWIDEYGGVVSEGYKMPTRDIKLSSLWLKKEISSSNDLKEFSEAVNNGVDCKGSTIQLKSNIDMSGVDDFKPIGTNEHPFRGTFEGHGHTIRNLVISTDTKYSGFFGNTFDATVKNIFFDESCSVESDYSMGYGCLGGVIGYCGAEESECTIVNVVNRGSVVFSGNNSEMVMNIGGTIGLCKGFTKGCVVSNCANYGSITVDGSMGSVWLGGIVGRGSGRSRNTVCKIWNNLNYGRIDFSGNHDVTKMGIGGIIGYCDRNNKVNGCVSMGGIDVGKTVSSGVGSVTGKKDSTSEATDNIWFWKIEHGDYDNGNLMIWKNLTLEDGTTVLSFLEDAVKARQIEQQGKYSEYTSTWVTNPNNATVKAKVNDKLVATYTANIVLLPTFMGSNEYYFKGWKKNDKGVKTMEVHTDSVFVGEWRETLKDILAIIAIVSAVFVVIVVVCVLSTLYAKGYKKLARKNKEIFDLLYPEIPEADAPEVSLDNIPDLYPKDYKRPTMEEALINAGLNENQALLASKSCYNIAHELERKGELPKGLTVDDAAAITLYTFDFRSNNYSINPYSIINSALLSNNIEGIRKAKDIIYLVMVALRKLPIVSGILLHRGIRTDVSGNAGGFNGTNTPPNYAKGSIITWGGMSSTTPDMEASKAFLARGSISGKASGTVFIIEDGWGYDIMQYSMFPEESEILLEPGRQFEVISSIQAAELTIVKLRMLKTTLALPDVYGRHPLRVPPLYFIEKATDRFEIWRKKIEELRTTEEDEEERSCVNDEKKEEETEKRGFDEDDNNIIKEKRGFNDDDDVIKEKRGFNDYDDDDVIKEKRGFYDDDIDEEQKEFEINSMLEEKSDENKGNDEIGSACKLKRIKPKFSEEQSLTQKLLS